MRLADLLVRYRQEFEEKYEDTVLPEQRRAIDAIINCRTGLCGETMMFCVQCDDLHTHEHSCGNRNCPQCQNHTTTDWLERQKAKLLPVRYYLVTFTLPKELRNTAYLNQRKVYDALFSASIDTVNDVASNPRHLGARPGMTLVLHSHSRQLNLHPHIHIILPAGGVMPKEQLWKQSSRKYMFPKDVLKILFREKFLARLRNEKIPYPQQLHKMDWVVNIRAAGNGEPAMKYLSKYLYRGVIQERNIISDKNGMITFQYLNSKTRNTDQITLPAADFIMRVIQHVLPKRFRRIRDTGFHHGNAKKTLWKIQVRLAAAPMAVPKTEKPKLTCRFCGACLIIVPKNFNPHDNNLDRIRGSPKW